RDKAAAGQLRRIAPRRFHPREEAWLPILHTQRGERHYTVLFSHTTRAHRWSKTRDGVVLYYDGGHEEQQCTVVTSQHGPLTGKRVVSGRTGECVSYYMLVMMKSARSQ